MAVQFADFQLRANLRILDRDAAECNVFSQDWRARTASDDAHLTASDTDAIPMGGRLVSLQFQADKNSLRMLLTAEEGPFPDKVVSLGLKVNRESNTSLERINLIVELIPGKDQP